MQEPHHCILSRRAEAAPKPPGERETRNVTLNAWTPRLQTLEDVAPYYALEYRFLTALSGCTARSPRRGPARSDRVCRADLQVRQICVCRAGL
jgi:hypothetical protein